MHEQKPSQVPPWPVDEKDPFKALQPYKWKIYEECHEHGVPWELAFRLVMVESQGNPRAYHANWIEDETGEKIIESEDFGLFQLNSKTFGEWQLRLLFRPGLNIELGVTFMADCYTRAKGNWYNALLLYNCGHIQGASLDSHQYAQRIIGGREWEN